MNQNNKLISVIVPCYKQADTIRQDLSNIQQALAYARFPSEIILVIDGAPDTTIRNLKGNRSPNLKILQLKKHRGKGFAVRFGMSMAKGAYISFIDAGMEIDPLGISMLLEHLMWYEADIIVGSKRHPASIVDYSLDRKILSFGYQWMVRLLFNIKVKDTQPGLKVFKREVLEAILPVLLVKNYAFDIEMLAVAHRYGYRRIYEAPIKLKHVYGSISNAATLRSIFHMLFDTAAVFYRLRILKYYDKVRCQNR